MDKVIVARQLREARDNLHEIWIDTSDCVPHVESEDGLSSAENVEFHLCISDALNNIETAIGILKVEAVLVRNSGGTHDA